MSSKNPIRETIQKAKRLIQNGDVDTAAVLYHQLIENYPHFHYFYIKLGEVLLSQNKLDEAISIFNILLSRNVRSPSLYYNISQIFIKQNKYLKAVAFLKKALKYNPSSAILSSSLCQVLLKCGYTYAAIHCIKQGLQFNPNYFWLHYNLGKAYFRQEHFDRAIYSIQQAIHLNPLSSEAYNKLGEVFLAKDVIEQAIVYFQEAIALDSNSAWYYQNLGNAVARQGHYSKSRKYYVRAVQINPNEVKRYNESLHIKPCNSKDIVTNPVFIVGCGHSGTSLILAILGSHPSFYPIPQESNLFMKNQNEIRATFHQWDIECREAGKTRWIEKTPMHIFHIGKLSLYRPSAQFILMLRDGRDVYCSLKKRYPNKKFSIFIDRWIYDNLAGLQYWNDPQVKVVKYEDLVVEPYKTLKDICKFLGEAYTPEILEYYKEPKFWYSNQIQKPKTHSGSDHTKLRNWQINQPIFDGRGGWKKEMTEQEKRLFKQKAQEYLEKFKYVNNKNW